MVVEEVLAAVDAGRMRKREAMYVLLCALPPSPIREALIGMVVMMERQEQLRVAVAQAAMNLENIPRAA